MINSELKEAIRSVIQEELKPIRQELEELKPIRQEFREFREEVNSRLAALEQGQDDLKKAQTRIEKNQRKMQKDIKEINQQLSGVWEDIKRLDNRLTIQEERAAR